MIVEVSVLLVIIATLIGVDSSPLKSLGDSLVEGSQVPRRRFARFKNLEGELELVDLYPEQNKLISNFAIDIDNVQFHLYTKKNVNESIRIYLNDTKGLRKTPFNPKYKTKFIVHGFLNNLNSDTVQTIKNNFLNMTNDDFNIIAVDWSYYTMIYLEVEEKTKAVGELIGNFIDYLIREGVPLSAIHCIGHSLGAHACGFAGSNVKSGQIAHITGLDPALPGFTLDKPTLRLDAADAVFVDCIHTCAGFLGIDEAICSADYYPNYGKNQPGCHWFDLGSCSHGRSHEFYAESILEDHLFPALTCESLDFSPDTCIYKGAAMGYPASDKDVGIFFSKTNNEYPFALNWTHF